MPAATPEEILPAGVHHYASAAEVPQQLAKYFHQRYDLFARYDEGVWLTDDAWFGVTPEPIALRIAAQLSLAAPASKTTLIDAFAGAGGNTIAFARSGRWERIFAVEKDPATLACAKHNAKVYGVDEKIWWIEGDVFSLLKGRLKDVSREAVVFGSPPWGGPSYTTAPIFDLSLMAPYSLADLYNAFVPRAQDMVLFLPRNADLAQIARFAANDGQKLPVIHYCMHGASKALCVFFGSWDGVEDVDVSEEGFEGFGDEEVGGGGDQEGYGYEEAGEEGYEYVE